MDEIIERIMNDPLNKDYTERGIKPILQVSPEENIDYWSSTWCKGGGESNAFS